MISTHPVFNGGLEPPTSPMLIGALSRLSYSPTCGRVSAHGPIYQMLYRAATGVSLLIMFGQAGKPGMLGLFAGEFDHPAGTPFAGHHEVQVFVGVDPNPMAGTVSLVAPLG